jgi:cytochrome b subunit of formate dehydrogenase
VHDLVSRDDAASPLHPTRLAATCGGCHADPELAEHFRFQFVRPIEAFARSVHARGIAAGEPAADCISCHGGHEILDAADPMSKVHHSRIPETCGTCHDEIARTFAESIHGLAARSGVRESPVCTDCHGEHRILSPLDSESPVHASNISRLTCGRCHGDLRLAEKFGMSADSVPAYQDSYHGLAMRSGVTTVAHCGSCHGVHEVLPSSDPRAMTHPDNLPATCGSCHPGAGTRFTLGPVHVLPNRGEHFTVLWARRLYLLIIALTVGAMVLHNGADLLAKIRNPPSRPAAAPTVMRVRMGLAFRIAHGLLVASFSVLVYSGFALTYPEAWWASPLISRTGNGDFRGMVHHVAAIVLLGTLVFHGVHLIVDRRARSCIRAMRPRREDWTEFRERVRFFLGLRSSPPHSPWLGYAEKLEYIALMWGMAIMTVTGILLWIPDIVLRWLPKWVTDLATAVHFYEAVLATLAILVWHFYFVIFDPVVYPLDRAFLSGKSAPGRDAERHDPVPSPKNKPGA